MIYLYKPCILSIFGDAMVKKVDLKATEVIKVSPRVKRLIERKGKFGESYDAVLSRILSKPKPPE